MILVEVSHPPLEDSAGVILTDGKSKTVITGDTTKDIPEKSFDLMYRPDLLIADSMIPPRGTIPKHMNAKEAMELASELEAKKVVLIHLSHHFPPHAGSVKEWPLGYDGNLSLRWLYLMFFTDFPLIALTVCRNFL